MDEHGYREWRSLAEPEFMGETMDIASRACVRRVLTGKMKSEPWCRWWVGVSEEIDFYLPKVFWREKRKMRTSAAKIFVNPDWPTFQKWHFDYPETRQRLLMEERFLDDAKRAADRKRSRKSDS